MIKANELRIGNFVKDRGGKTIRIDFIEHVRNGYDTKFGQLMYLEGEEVHPMTEYSHYALAIPLTEEWLLKFGFEKGKNDWFAKKYFTDCDECSEVMKVDYNLSSKRLAIYDAIEETDMVNILSYPIYAGKRINYVHQLQNIYFALTGEEL